MAKNSENKVAKLSKKMPESGAKRRGRPPFEMSVRSVAKYLARKDPKVIENAVKNSFAILQDKTNPNFVRMIDWLTKVMGGYDPVETKDVTPRNLANPYAKFSREELKKMLSGEKSSKSAENREKSSKTETENSGNSSAEIQENERRSEK